MLAKVAAGYANGKMYCFTICAGVILQSTAASKTDPWSKWSLVPNGPGGVIDLAVSQNANDFTLYALVAHGTNPNLMQCSSQNWSWSSVQFLSEALPNWNSISGRAYGGDSNLPALLIPTTNIQALAPNANLANPPGIITNEWHAVACLKGSQDGSGQGNYYIFASSILGPTLYQYTCPIPTTSTPSSSTNWGSPTALSSGSNIISLAGTNGVLFGLVWGWLSYMTQSNNSWGNWSSITYGSTKLAAEDLAIASWGDGTLQVFLNANAFGTGPYVASSTCPTIVAGRGLYTIQQSTVGDLSSWTGFYSFPDVVDVTIGVPSPSGTGNWTYSSSEMNAVSGSTFTVPNIASTCFGIQAAGSPGDTATFQETPLSWTSSAPPGWSINSQTSTGLLCTTTPAATGNPNGYGFVVKANYTPVGGTPVSLTSPDPTLVVKDTPTGG